MTKTTSNTTSWDDASNEAKNSFVSWGKIGDFVYGTLVGVKQVKSTLPGKEGQLQNVYEVKVKQSSYHNLDEDKRPMEKPETPEEGEIVSVGGRAGTDSRMARVKIGQMFGQKFVEELPAQTKGFNKTKIIKVFTPKDITTGEYLMDEEFLAEQQADVHGVENDF